MKIGTGNNINSSANNDTGSRKKRCAIAATLLALVLGLCALTPTVQAEEMHAEESGQLAAWTGLSSQGNLVYREAEKGAQIYASDFLLLRNMLDTIPDMVYEPACYTHTHRWAYINVNGETHTRHCEFCGNAFDLVGAHRAERKENCTLSYDGAEYPGIRYTCTCGYQWEREETHALLFESVDETCHRNRCRLDGTPFCPGYEPVTEEHYAYHYIPCEDGLHHMRVCVDCGYRAEEECCFSLPDPNSGGENGSAENTDGGSIRRCWCGNTEKADADAESGEDSSDTETDGEDENPETAADLSGAETREENPGAETETTITETEEQMPDTEADT